MGPYTFEMSKMVKMFTLFHSCLELRNQSVKAMRFPPKKYSEELETAEVIWLDNIFYLKIQGINFYLLKYLQRKDELEKKKN